MTSLAPAVQGRLAARLAGMPASVASCRRPAGPGARAESARTGARERAMLYILLWLLGVPLGIILLLFLFGVGR